MKTNTIDRKTYQISWRETRLVWQIELTAISPYNHSCHWPNTTSVLSRLLPSIFTCKCFNAAGKPFSEELEATEIGHLFEHILLEFLCQHKLMSGYSEALFKGCTYWLEGSVSPVRFAIQIQKSPTDSKIFLPALIASAEVLEKIYGQQPTTDIAISDLTVPYHTKPETVSSLLGVDVVPTSYSWS